MDETRRRHDGAFKARVVLEAIRSQRTIAEIAHAYAIPIRLPPRRGKSWNSFSLSFSVDGNKREMPYEE